MGRLIDAYELYLGIVKKGQASKRYKIGECWELNGAEIWEVINAQLTAGFVEIVRCKDCRLFKGAGRECCMGLYVFDDDFCSVGVRRVADGD